MAGRKRAMAAAETVWKLWQSMITQTFTLLLFCVSMVAFFITVAKALSKEIGFTRPPACADFLAPVTRSLRVRWHGRNARLAS